jgi:hypothetical protein
MYAVSCQSQTFCIAMTGGTTGELWNGSSWSAEPMVDPGNGVSFTSVSCESLSACVAVGNYNNGPGNLDNRQTTSEVWNGSSWDVVSTTNPASDSELFDVSCTSTHFCVAVGSARQAPNDQGAWRPLAESYGNALGF